MVTVEEWLRGYITLPTLTPQSALIGLLKDASRGDYALASHILLILKRARYELRLSKAKPSIYSIKHKLKHLANLIATIKVENFRFHDLIK